MADTKLSALTEATTLGTDDELYINDSGTSKRITRANFQAALSIAASQLSDVTATAAELNILDGATLDVTELNYVDGVTSAIQTQLDAISARAAEAFARITVTGGTPSIDDSHGFSSLTDVSLGVIRCNFTSAQPDTNFTTVCTNNTFHAANTAQNTAYVDVRSYDNTHSLADPTTMNVVVHH